MDLTWCFVADIQSKLDKLNMNLQQCWKSLLNHLERRRQKFPRFYFLSTEDVLHVVCNGKLANSFAEIHVTVI